MHIALCYVTQAALHVSETELGSTVAAGIEPLVQRVILGPPLEGPRVQAAGLVSFISEALM